MKAAVKKAGGKNLTEMGLKKEGVMDSESGKLTEMLIRNKVNQICHTILMLTNVYMRERGQHHRWIIAT